MFQPRGPNFFLSWMIAWNMQIPKIMHRQFCFSASSFPNYKPLVWQINTHDGPRKSLATCQWKLFWCLPWCLSEVRSWLWQNFAKLTLETLLKASNSCTVEIPCVLSPIVQLFVVLVFPWLTSTRLPSDSSKNRSFQEWLYLKMWQYLEEHPIATFQSLFDYFFRYRTLPLPQRDGPNSLFKTHFVGKSLERSKWIGTWTQHENQRSRVGCVLKS